MKKIFKSLLYVIFFIFISMALLPKQELFYFLEKNLQKQNIVISNEEFKNRILGFDLEYADIYYEQINIANVEKLSVNSYLFYNQVSVKNVRLLDSFKSMFPTPLTNIYLTYSIFDYENIQIKADGIFGKLDGKINLIDKKAIVYLNASNNMKSNYSNVLRKMKFIDGRYIYEYKF